MFTATGTAAVGDDGHTAHPDTLTPEAVPVTVWISASVGDVVGVLVTVAVLQPIIFGPELGWVTQTQTLYVPAGRLTRALKPWFSPAPGAAAAPVGLGWLATAAIHCDPMFSATETDVPGLAGQIAYPVTSTPVAFAVTVSSLAIEATGSGTSRVRHPSCTGGPSTRLAHTQKVRTPGSLTNEPANP
jgi:hypothetical protein